MIRKWFQDFHIYFPLDTSRSYRARIFLLVNNCSKKQKTEKNRGSALYFFLVLSNLDYNLRLSAKLAPWSSVNRYPEYI